MKKRLLALALCLAMMTSLLPLTAAAETFDCGSVFVGLEYHGVYCEDVQFTFHPENLPNELSGAYGLHASPDFGTDWVMTEDNGVYTLHVGAGVELLELLFKVVINGQEQEASGAVITLKNGHNWSAWTSNGDGTHSRTCSNGCVNSPQTASCADTSPADCKCDVAGESLHDWQFTRTDSTLTAVCNHSYCPTKEVSATLKADSVTLPESPFNAQVILNGITEEEIKKEFRYEIGPIRYKFKAPGDSAFTEITPADGAREGTYQAAVTLSPKEVAARYARNDDGTTQGLVTEPDGSITLYTQYTAVNPETTAQTGDNRPIELMMGSVVAFSALAAAAFILDSKRRSRQ